MNNALNQSVEMAITAVAERSKLIVENCSDTGESRLGAYEELKKLSELREQGIITDEEFEIEKKKILNSSD